MRKGLALPLILVGVLAGGYLLWRSITPFSGGGSVATSTITIVSDPVVTEKEEPLKPRRTPPEGYKEYYDEQYRFSLFYPANLVSQAYGEGNGASTIIFQNTKESVGFQIFIAPYGQDKISSERFKKDMPSGVRENEKPIQIDGVPAISFYGEQTFLGDTAEIWFIHGGHLFEVTTHKSLAAWLSQSMITWQFL